MGKEDIRITRADIQLHKEFRPLLQKSQSTVKQVSVLTAGNLAFAKKLLERYSGQFFYDFDFSAFVFLEKLKEQKEKEERNAKERILYITSETYRSTIRHLQTGNRILPAVERLKQDFTRQTLLVNWLQTRYRELAEREILTAGQTGTGGTDRSGYTGADGNDGRIAALPYTQVLQILSRERPATAAVSEVRELEEESHQTSEKHFLWKQIYRDLLQIAGESYEKSEETASFAEKKQQIRRGLEQLIEEKQIIRDIFEELHREIREHNFQDFEEEKLCFLSIVKDYEYRYENTGLRNLIYKISGYSREEWEEFKNSEQEELVRLTRLEEVQRYMKQIVEELTERHDSFPVLREALKLTTTESFRQIKEWSEVYDEMVSRHMLIGEIFREYEEDVRQHRELNFLQKKNLLVERLESLKKEHSHLFQDNKSRTKVQTFLEEDSRKKLQKLLHLEEAESEISLLECMTKETIQKLRKSDRISWEHFIKELQRWHKQEIQENRIHSFVQEKKTVLQGLAEVKMAVLDLEKFVHVSKQSKKWLGTAEADEQREELKVLLRSLIWKDQKTERRHLGQVFSRLDQITEEYEKTVIKREGTSAETRMLHAQILEVLERIQKLKDITQKTAEDYRTERSRYLTEVLLRKVAEEFEEKEYQQRIGTDRQWIYEMEQWEERKRVLSQIYQNYLLEKNEKQTLRTLEEEKQYIIRQLRQYGKKYEILWNPDTFRTVQEYTLYTERGSTLARLVHLNRKELEQDLTEVFFQEGMTRLHQMNQKQWGNFLEQLEQTYGEKQRFLQERRQIRELRKMTEEAVQMQTLTTNTAFYKKYHHFLKKEQEMETSVQEWLIKSQENQKRKTVGITEFEEEKESLMELIHEKSSRKEYLRAAEADSGISETFVDHLFFSREDLIVRKGELVQRNILQKEGISFSDVQKEFLPLHREQEERFEEFRGVLTTQKVQIEQLTKEQRQIRELLARRTEQLEEVVKREQKQEKEMPQRVIRQLENELRMERLRRGME